ncbi:alpha-1,6-mannosyl-glycoprotein 2-beta-N-acetylglucosaminyltransferase-like isoform X2 [Ornithodoros turicata]|uniref:alpha-1,6-mannosyl-glycoprotein 2-beta-N-acetylglucosaminyltransferase-like isoform X2 n=1 Tax=Ornithodoros turicata TaxID=34597 RepID=UPI0031393B93
MRFYPSRGGQTSLMSSFAKQRLSLTKFLLLVIVVDVLLISIPIFLGKTKAAIPAGAFFKESAFSAFRREALRSMIVPNSSVDKSNLTALHEIVTKMNTQQVHNRWRYLSHLLSSLAQVEGIEKALIILSHDYYDNYLPLIPHSASFCKVMQIFYPNSTQLYPFTFPGQDPRDCPRNMKPEHARKIKCLGADHPDVYNHYREPKFTQIKLHWWWKMNTVFHKLNITKNHAGPVLLLEEDHYVTPDLLVMAELMLSQKSTFCNDAACLCSVGNNKWGSHHHPANADKIEVRQWQSSTNNLGHLITRDVWNIIRSCAHAFCTYDDYNWDLTLTALANTCYPKGSLQVSLRSSRVMHIGDCGVHSKSHVCKELLLKGAVRAATQSRACPRPTSLIPIKTRYHGTPKTSGGWGDVRDHDLCLSWVTPDGATE